MQLKIKSRRLLVVLIFFLGLLFLFLGQLVYIEFFRSSFLLKLASKQQTYYLELQPQRGVVYDRMMRPLAINVATFSLYAVPPQVKDKQKVIDQLCGLLGLDKGFLAERLSRKKQFVWLARKLNWEDAAKVRAMDLDGLHFVKESRRSYPNGTLASHVLGFAGLDNIGLDGLEMSYDAYLKGVSGWTFVMRDAKKRDLALADILQPPTDGYSLVLTIDQVMQYITEREIDKVFEKYRAKGATIVVMDIRTGEILALANRPTFDLNDPNKTSIESRRNRAVTDFFEPGSVYKIVTASAALEEKKFTLQNKIFCENGKYQVANHILHDVHPYGWLTFGEVISQSSNIGTTKIAQAIGGPCVFAYSQAFGMGALTSVDLPGEVSGVLKPVSVWSKTSIGAVPIGQEVCVTALQLVGAIASIANGGNYMKPFVVASIIDKRGEVIRKFEPQVVRRVISAETAALMRQILTTVVESGTGKLAQSKLFKFAGKTGTAQKIEPNGTYSHSKFMASFIGFAPADDPRVAIVVIVDEPRPYYYGGVVSAPAFRVIAEDVLRYLQANADVPTKLKDSSSDAA